MRYLFVLRGIPGSGKSTFIQEHDLEPYTICPDNIRMLLGGTEYNLDGKPGISQNNEAETWNIVNDLLEKRLSKGILTIIDATSIQVKTLKQYKKLCEKYNYRLYVVNFDTEYEECYKRNKKRVIYKQVPEEVLINMHMKLLLASDDKELTKFNMITPNDMCKIMEPSRNDWLKQNQIDLTNYEKVIVFGDIHGCYTVLDEVMKTYDYSDKNFYIFTGDMFDRGIENKQVLQFCLDNCEKKNFIFLEGNHDTHLKEYLREGRVATPAFGKTLDEFGELRDKMGKYTRKLRQFACIRYHNIDAIITHGGIPCLPYPKMPTYQIIKGVGKYQDSDYVDEQFSKNSERTNKKEHGFISIHGHRNINNVKIWNTDNTFNLEGKVELGGELRYVELSDKIHIKPLSCKNKVFDLELNRKHILKASPFRELDSSDLVHKKELANGIVSYNFTRDAFNKKAWNDITITARGLFVDSNDASVVARSYPKFFAIGERESTSYSNLKKCLAFPMNAYRKENGFLGIVSYDKYTDDLFIASKSTNEGPYKEYFEKILLEALGDKKVLLKEICRLENESFIFECIDPVNDPHIIEYAKPHVVLLDVVTNDLTNTFKNYSYIKSAAEQFGIECKKADITLRDFDEFRQFIDNIESDKYPFSIKYEGWVFVDSNHYMLKYKTPYYTFWKKLRSYLPILKDHAVKIQDPNMENIATYIKFFRPDLLDKSIIEIRNEYYKSKRP